MRLQTFYELRNGQEAQREFQYLKWQTDERNLQMDGL